MGQLTGALEKLATPALYERNPFFMLGLPVGASSKEIARRKEDIEAEIEMGNASTVFAHYGNVPDEFAIKDAFAALEDPEQKLLYGFFWFWPMDGQPNDGVPTLPQLQKKDFSNLRAIWKDASEAYNDDALRGRHNLAILAYFMALFEENAGAATADSYWRESIEYWNQLADEDDFWFLVSAHVRKLGDPRLTTGAVRRLRQQLPMFFDQINVKYAEKYARAGDTQSAKRHREYMEISQPELDDIDGTTENAFAAFEDQVARLTEEARRRAHDHPEDGLQAVDDLLKGCRPAANMATAMALDENEIGATLFTRIIQAVHACLVCYGNKTRDWAKCVMYTVKAREFACSAQAKCILNKDEDTLKRLMKPSPTKSEGASKPVRPSKPIGVSEPVGTSKPTRQAKPISQNSTQVPSPWSHILSASGEDESIIAKGGYVDGVDIQLWQDLGGFTKFIGPVAIISLIVSLVLLPQADAFYDKSADIYVAVWVLSVAGVVFFLSQLLNTYLASRGFQVRPANGEAPGSLGTLNGMGVSLLGTFRTVGQTNVAYTFFMLFVPIIPLGCYRVRVGEMTGGYKHSSVSYKIFGTERWSGLEILNIYLTYYSVTTMIFGTLGLVISCFE